jgi:hypothetical protein
MPPKETKRRRNSRATGSKGVQERRKITEKKINEREHDMLEMKAWREQVDERHQEMVAKQKKAKRDGDLLAANQYRADALALEIESAIIGYEEQRYGLEARGLEEELKGHKPLPAAVTGPLENFLRIVRTEEETREAQKRRRYHPKQPFFM